MGHCFASLVLQLLYLHSQDSEIYWVREKERRSGTTDANPFASDTLGRFFSEG